MTEVNDFLKGLHGGSALGEMTLNKFGVPHMDRDGDGQIDEKESKRSKKDEAQKERAKKVGGAIGNFAAIPLSVASILGGGKKAARIVADAAHGASGTFAATAGTPIAERLAGAARGAVDNVKFQSMLDRNAQNTLSSMTMRAKRNGGFISNEDHTILSDIADRANARRMSDGYDVAALAGVNIGSVYAGREIGGAIYDAKHRNGQSSVTKCDTDRISETDPKGGSVEKVDNEGFSFNRASDALKKFGNYDESKHPRDDHGRWSHSTGAAIGAAAAGAAAIGAGLYLASRRGRLKAIANGMSAPARDFGPAQVGYSTRALPPPGSRSVAASAPRDVAPTGSGPVDQTGFGARVRDQIGTMYGQARSAARGATSGFNQTGTRVNVRPQMSNAAQGHAMAYNAGHDVGQRARSVYNTVTGRTPRGLSYGNRNLPVAY